MQSALDMLMTMHYTNLRFIIIIIIITTNGWWQTFPKTQDFWVEMMCGLCIKSVSCFVLH